MWNYISCFCDPCTLVLSDIWLYVTFHPIPFWIHWNCPLIDWFFFLILSETWFGAIRLCEGWPYFIIALRIVKWNVYLYANSCTQIIYFCQKNLGKVKQWLYCAVELHWASKETYHIFRVTLTKIQSININHIWTQIRQIGPLRGYVSHWAANACERSEFWIRQIFWQMLAKIRARICH